MTAVSTTLVRSGTYSRSTGVDTDALDRTPEPDIYAHRWRDGFRVYWCITAGRDGFTLAHGEAWTRGGALVKANAAAQHPGLSAWIRDGGAS